jgi:hypothetical protein
MMMIGHRCKKETVWERNKGKWKGEKNGWDKKN